MADETISIGEIERRARRAAARALNLACQEVGARSLPRVPLEFGDLRGSGHQSKEATPDDLTASWAYTTAYAAAQHEGYAVQHREGSAHVNSLFDVGHHRGRQRLGGSTYTLWQARRWTTPGTGPKFLEAPLKEFVPEFEGFMAAAMRPFFDAAAGA